MRIEDYITTKGGYTKETLAKFGVEWPPKKGWKKLLQKELDKKYGKQPKLTKGIIYLTPSNCYN